MWPSRFSIRSLSTSRYEENFTSDHLSLLKLDRSSCVSVCFSTLQSAHLLTMRILSLMKSLKQHVFICCSTVELIVLFGNIVGSLHWKSAEFGSQSTMGCCRRVLARLRSYADEIVAGWTPSSFDFALTVFTINAFLSFYMDTIWILSPLNHCLTINPTDFLMFICRFVIIRTFFFLSCRIPVRLIYWRSWWICRRTWWSCCSRCLRVHLLF